MNGTEKKRERSTMSLVRCSHKILRRKMENCSA
uniref:Uncharacterized protein n=1 Tax=Anguilla anguilla TaxID=7936 RepID=A0A0E9XS32_ANGAN